MLKWLGANFEPSGGLYVRALVDPDLTGRGHELVVVQDNETFEANPDKSEYVGSAAKVSPYNTKWVHVFEVVK